MISIDDPITSRLSQALEKELAAMLLAPDDDDKPEGADPAEGAGAKPEDVPF